VFVHILNCVVSVNRFDSIVDQSDR